MEIQNPRLFQLVWVHPGPSPGPSPRFGCRPPRCCPLGFEFPFHLGHRAHHRQATAAGGRGGINVFPQRDKRNRAVFKPTFKGPVCPDRFFVLRALHTMHS